MHFYLAFDSVGMQIESAHSAHARIARWKEQRREREHKAQSTFIQKRDEMPMNT